MPGYVIHLAVGKIYLQNNKIKNIEKFERGIIAPDMEKDKSKSHYGPYSSKPGLEDYLKEQKELDDYKEGYFLHLVTDYLFYNKFLKKWDKSIYEDYDKLNRDIIDRYGVIVPKEVEKKVDFIKGDTTILKKEQVYKFIDSVGRINIREIIEKDRKDIEKRLSNIEFEERG